MRNRLLTWGATLAVLTSGGCETQSTNECGQITSIAEECEAEVGDVITDIEADNDERHPRDDRPPRTPGGNDDVFDEDNEIIDEDITEEDTTENNDTNEDVTEEDTVIDYPLDPSMEENCSTENGDMNNLIPQYENIVLKSFAEIIEGREDVREMLSKYNVDTYFKERVQRFWPNNNLHTVAVSGYSSNENLEQLMVATQAIRRSTQELLGGMSIMMIVNRNDSLIPKIEFTRRYPNDPDHIFYIYNFRYDPNTHAISGCTIEYGQPNLFETNTVVDNLCLDLCERVTNRIPDLMPNFFESEYSQPVE